MLSSFQPATKTLRAMFRLTVTYLLAVWVCDLRRMKPFRLEMKSMRSTMWSGVELTSVADPDSNDQLQAPYDGLMDETQSRCPMGLAERGREIES